MFFLRTLERSVFLLEDLLASAQLALDPVSEGFRCQQTALELMQLENRIVLSGVPPGADGIIDDALAPAGSEATDVEEFVANDAGNTIAFSQSINIDPRDRVVARFAIGNSSSDADQRFVGHGLTHTGWGPFIDEMVLPALQAGFTRVELHNPFGKGADDQFMAFDQYLDALVETPKLTENFVELWRPITDSGVEVIGYIGSARHNPEQLALLDDPDAWWDRALAAVQPLVDAGMSIGLDSSANAPADDPVVALAEHLREQGVRVYVEARPLSSSTHWFDYPLILLSKTWDSQAPENSESQVDRHAWEHELTGEVVRIVFPTEEDGIDYQEMKEVLEEGHTSTIRARQVWDSRFGEGISLDEFLDGLGIASLPTRINLAGSSEPPDDVTYEVIAGPSHGQLTIDPDNPSLVTYTSDAYYSGSDSFTFRTTDGGGNSETATVFLGIQGFTRPPDFSPATDPISDMAARRLTELLEAHGQKVPGQLNVVPPEMFIARSPEPSGILAESTDSRSRLSAASHSAPDVDPSAGSAPFAGLNGSSQASRISAVGTRGNTHASTHPTNWSSMNALAYTQPVTAVDGWINGLADLEQASEERSETPEAEGNEVPTAEWEYHEPISQDVPTDDHGEAIVSTHGSQSEPDKDKEERFLWVIAWWETLSKIVNLKSFARFLKL